MGGGGGGPRGRVALRDGLAAWLCAVGGGGGRGGGAVRGARLVGLVDGWTSRLLVLVGMVWCGDAKL